MNTLISLKQVLERIPLSKTELYRRIKAGTFPAQVKLGPSRIAFVEAEVSQWIATAVARSHGGNDA